MRKILAIAAHPDDEVLGCGGTLARHADQGDEVTVLLLGEGITSRYANRDEASADLIAHLGAASRKAGDVLGVTQVIAHRFPDNRFDTVPLLEVVKVIEAAITEVAPTIVYTNHGGDLNIDHSTVFRATLTATRSIPSGHIEEVRAFEVPSSTEWSFQRLEPLFRANLFVDISGTLDRKLAAMDAYESEMRPFPHPRSPEAIRGIAQRWGSVAGVPAAEAFDVVRRIGGP